MLDSFIIQKWFSKLQYSDSPIHISIIKKEEEGLERWLLKVRLTTIKYKKEEEEKKKTLDGRKIFHDHLLAELIL